MKTTWRAEIPIRFAEATVAQVKRLLGTVMPYETGYSAAHTEKTDFSIVGNSSIPDYFDVREAWPNCASISGRVRFVTSMSFHLYS